MRNKKLYNYLVNTFDISRDSVLKHVESRIEELLDKHVKAILESNRIERMIINRLSDYMAKGKADYWSTDKNFEKIVDNQVRNVIEDYLKDRCKITFQFQNNSVRFMEDR